MHLFLTGEKRVGKSTLLCAITSAFHGKLGGFRTVRLQGLLPDQYSVHLLPANERQIPSQENLLFVCGKRSDDVKGRFEKLGCKALKNSAGAALILMDELGPHEAEAAMFQKAVWSALEGKIPVLGVLQKSDSSFLKKIARHPNVVVIEVTEENRYTLAQRIPELLEILRRW